MAPIVFKRNKAEKRPNHQRPRHSNMSVSVQTNDLSSNVDDELSPLDMERKFLECKAPQDTDALTPDTVDSIVMTFSDDSDDDGKFEEESKDSNDQWCIELTPVKKNTKQLSALSPYSKLACESSKRPPLSPLDQNYKSLQSIKSIRQKTPPTNTKKDKQQKNNCSDDIKHELEKVQEENRRLREMLRLNKMPPSFPLPAKETTPMKQWNKSLGRSLMSPAFELRHRKESSPKLSPLDKNALLTPAKDHRTSTDRRTSIGDLLDLSLNDEDDVTVEIKSRKKKEDDNISVISGLSKIEEHQEEAASDADAACDAWGLVVQNVDDSFETGEGLLSQFLHTFTLSPQKEELD